MEFEKMETVDLEQRKSAIAEELEAEDADLDALEKEVKAINEELEKRKTAEAKRVELREAVKRGEGVVINEMKEERKPMENIEVRNTKAYIDAFAEYIKSEDDKEVRALLTENVSGTVPVPELVYEEIKRAWDDEPLMRYVRKTYVKGNLKVGFEISATGAVKHTEGSGAVTEETLVLGVVNIVPAYIKKWISFSDEVMSMRGEAFLRYIYAELAHKIAKKAADDLIALINAASTQSTTTAVGVAAIKSTQITQSLIAGAVGNLSDEAANPIVVMNKLTWAAFKAAQYAGNFNADIFEGYDVVFNNSITDFATATSGVAYAYVGDFGYGAIANFPDGEEIRFTFDDITLADQDLIKIVGKEYVGLGLVAPKAFVKITK